MCLKLTAKAKFSWILKQVIKQQGLYVLMKQDSMESFKMKKAYRDLQSLNSKVSWRKIMYHNIARPHAIFILWLACNGRLATKDRLKKFGMVDNENCVFCSKQENIQHILFECCRMKGIWAEVLSWSKVHHVPLPWDGELV